VRRLAAGLTLMLSLVLVAACGGDEGGGGPDVKLEVVAGFYPVAEATGRIAGGRAEVVNITPAGTEPHDLELTPRQVDQLEDADLVVYVGGDFQPAVERAVERRRGPKLDVLEGLPLDANPAEEAGGHAEEHDEHGVDPHFWLDPVLMVQTVDQLQAALTQASPAHRAEFEANAEAYRSELRALDAEYRAALSICERKELVTSHAAFHYLARRYGLAQQPIAGLSPEAEPDPARLAELSDLVRRLGVTTIFYESLVSPRVAQALAQETGTRTAVLDPIEGLTEEQRRQGQTYVGVMGQNLAALKAALGCR
jgi:zinc transport system substrate-binding protein